MRLFIGLALLVALLAPAAAAEPAFDRYPAPVYGGPPHMPAFLGRDRAYVHFRTRIRDGMRLPG